MACFARSNCVFGGIGTFTTCGCGVNLCGMNNNCCCNQSCDRCNRCIRQVRNEVNCGCDHDCGCDNDCDRSGCDRCD
ncbi:MAG: hypothetical protein E7449_06270 [Ruminococcaceae bacterium]|nr:hypothetical protein [Oscillospiraceae bacterium]